VFKNGVLKKNIWIQDEEDNRSLKKELHNLYSSPDIISMVKSGRMSWTGHVARIVGIRLRTSYQLEDLEVRRMSYSIMWHRAVLLEFTEVLVECIDSIFRVEDLVE
jgi:hypothetical protein